MGERQRGSVSGWVVEGGKGDESGGFGAGAGWGIGRCGLARWSARLGRPAAGAAWPGGRRPVGVR